MEPKRYHHGDLKRTLLKVADTELAKHGIQGLSLREIAKQAGVSHTAPYKHFRDKDQLLSEMVVAEYKNLILFTEEVEWRYPDNSEAQFMAVAERVLNLADVSPRKFNLMLSTPTGTPLSNEITGFHNLIKENLLRLVAGDSPRQTRAVDVFWFSLVGAGLLCSQGHLRTSVPIEKLSQQLVETLSF